MPQAKNVMLRAMREILDPSPIDVGPVWDHFESRCAYCDVALDIAGRSAHIDHAEAAGGNHLGNLVLACGSCNGDDKRDMPWRDFVASKSSVDRDAARASRPDRGLGAAASSSGQAGAAGGAESGR